LTAPLPSSVPTTAAAGSSANDKCNWRNSCDSSRE
jgi:hypothetical protein